jgi:hypothetical protein
MATLYTTEPLNQHIWLPHKQHLSPVGSQLSADAHCFRQSYLVAWHFSISFVDCQPRTGRLTDHHHYTIAITLTLCSSQPPCLFAPINNQLMSHSLPSIHVVKSCHQASGPVRSRSRGTLSRKMLHVDCLPLFRYSILSLVKLWNTYSLARNCADLLQTCLVLV